MSGIVNFLSTVFSGFAGSVLSVLSSRKKFSELENELKAAKTEIERLNTRLAEFTLPPLILNDEGFYYDATGKPYCSGCYGSLYNRTPLKPLHTKGSWTLYQCPTCKEQYQAGKAPPNNPKRHNTLDDFYK
jgi:hypothetical protein